MMEKKTIEMILGAEESHRSATFHDLIRSIMPVPVEREEGPVYCRKQNVVALEELPQIRLIYAWEGNRVERDIAITMRMRVMTLISRRGFFIPKGFYKVLAKFSGFAKQIESLRRCASAEIRTSQLPPSAETLPTQRLCTRWPARWPGT